MFKQTKSRTLKWSTAGAAALAAASALAGPAQATVIPELPEAQLPGAPATCAITMPVRFDRARRMRQNGRAKAACAGQLGYRVIEPGLARTHLVSGRIRVVRPLCALEIVSGRLALDMRLLPHVDGDDRALAKIDWRALRPGTVSPLAGTASVNRAAMVLDGSLAFRPADAPQFGCAARLQPGTLTFNVSLSALSHDVHIS